MAAMGRCHTYTRASWQSWPLFRSRYSVSSSGTCSRLVIAHAAHVTCKSEAHQQRLVFQLREELFGALGQGHLA